MRGETDEYEDTAHEQLKRPDSSRALGRLPKKYQGWPFAPMALIERFAGALSGRPSTKRAVWRRRMHGQGRRSGE